MKETSEQIHKTHDNDNVHREAYMRKSLSHVGKSSKQEKLNNLKPRTQKVTYS